VQRGLWDFYVVQNGIELSHVSYIEAREPSLRIGLSGGGKDNEQDEANSAFRMAYHKQFAMITQNITMKLITTVDKKNVHTRCRSMYPGNEQDDRWFRTTEGARKTQVSGRSIEPKSEVLKIWAYFQPTIKPMLS
jgi:hypothetical protein